MTCLQSTLAAKGKWTKCSDGNSGSYRMIWATGSADQERKSERMEKRRGLLREIGGFPQALSLRLHFRQAREVGGHFDEDHE